MTVIEQALAIREAMDVACATLTDEKAMECARLYSPWQVGKNYTAGERLAFGVNGIGDPQLYKVNQDHVSQAGWLPDTNPALYTAIGLDSDGYPVWSKPTGAHDAYNKGDVVNYNGILYESLIDGNVHSPDDYPSGWKIFSE
jgi:hypothetical protein